MKYILRKFVEAETVEAAIAKDAQTPVHDAYLKEGEEPRVRDSHVAAIGFRALSDLPAVDEYLGEPLSSRKKR